MVAVLTLAIGIAANAVVFSVLNALVLRPIDLPESQNLYMVEYGKQHFEQSYPDYVDVRDRSRAFEGVLAFTVAAAGLDNGHGSSQAWLYEASGNYFDVLGIQPYLGRFFHGSDEHGPDSAPYIVMSYAYWQSHYQGDPGVIGRTVQLNKYPFTVIGVAPPDFRGTALFFAGDLWVPLVNQAQIEGENLLNARRRRGLWIIGRLKSGVSLAQLQARSGFHRHLARNDLPERRRWRELFAGAPGADGRFHRQAGAGLRLRPDAAGGTDSPGRLRQPGQPVRGARRRPLQRSCVAPGARVEPRPHHAATVDGGHHGLDCGRFARAGRQRRPAAVAQRLASFAEFPINVPVNPDATVYAVALLLALASGLLFGMVPVRQVLAINPYQVIKSGASGVGRRLTVRDLLLVGQIAICAVLVTASLVAVRGLVRSLHSDFGFLTRNALLLSTDLGMARYTADQQPVMQRRMLDAALAIPGVTAAGFSNTLPLNLDQSHSTVYADTATDLRESKAAAKTLEFCVSPGYFEAAGTTLLAGRSLTWHDDRNAPRVAVVNQEFARQVFGSAEKALGGTSSGGTGSGSRWWVWRKTESTRPLPRIRGAAMFYSDPAIALQPHLAGRAVQPRSAATDRGGTASNDARPRCRLAVHHTDLVRRTGRRPVSGARSDGIAGSAGRAGRDAGDYRHFRHGCVLGKQAAAGIRDSDRSGSAA